MAISLDLSCFRMLLAVGWVDGALGAREASIVLSAARQAGLPDEDLSALDAESRMRVPFPDVAHLERAQRLVLFGLARWIVLADRVVTPSEENALFAVALHLGLTPLGRRLVDEVVDELVATRPQELDGSSLDLEGLVTGVEAKLAAQSA